jgi:5-methylcytosine-specific restriction enzyme B
LETPESSAGKNTTPTSLAVPLTDGAIRNGYIHFPLSKSVFSSEHYGDPGGVKKGVPLKITDHLGGIHVDDVRVSGGTARLRSRFGSYFKNAHAAQGDHAVLTMTAPGEYALSISKGTIPKSSPTSFQQLAPEREAESAENSMNKPTNTILFGPPGTGKTYATTSKAVQLCDGQLPEGGGEAVRERYEQLRLDGRVSFVTFHQSYGYEEFVEGLRPVAQDGQVVYEVLPGAFKRACTAARLRRQITPGLSGKPLRERTLFKMSLGYSKSQEGTTVFDYCIENQCVLLGWGKDIDFSECNDRSAITHKIAEDAPGIDKPSSQESFVDRFKHEMKVGDIILVSQGNRLFRAVAEVTGEYEYVEDAPFHQMRAVRWLAIFEAGQPANELYDRNVVMSSLYQLSSEAIQYEKLEELLAEQAQSGPEQPHVLIIDEINRANISKVFGELITLIEPDKREGQANAVTLKLPYSGEDFSVPSNLHLLGTMNTADRSIALLDTALRRRFEFEEVMPQPDLLRGRDIEGIDLSRMLQAMNQRIEVLYDRDHTIGHAYLMGVKSLEDLDRAFRFKMLPLLQEYFYENFSQVRRVLSDLGEGDFVRRTVSPPVPADVDQDVQDEPVVTFAVNPMSFPVAAFKRIYGASE